MNRLKLACAGLLIAVLTTSCARVAPDEIGVRTKNLAWGKGIVPEDQSPGYHRFLWPLDSWHRFPSTVQSIRFALQADLTGRGVGAPIELTSAEGDRVVISAEVLFCIAEGGAHKVLQDSGSGDRFREVAQGLAQDAARALFGKLRTEEFYDVRHREAVRRELVSLLSERLAARHMELVDFLVETIEFGPGYEALIRTKKVADQKVELEIAKTKAAEERAKVTLVKTQTEIRLNGLQKQADITMMKLQSEMNLKIAGLNAEAEKHASEHRANGILYQGLKEAEGTRVTKAAEAASTRLKNKALVGDGGRNLVALETVKGLNLPEMTIPSDGYPWLNPLDMATRFGGGDGNQPASRDVREPAP